MRAELDQAQASYMTLYNLTSCIPAYIAYVNADTLRYEFVNDLFEKSFAIPREKIIGSHVRDIIGEANYQFARKYIDQAKTGKTTTYENVFNLVSGKRWIQVNCTPVLNPEGRVTSLVVMSYDITRHRQAEEDLHASQQITDGIMNAIPVRVFWKDRNLVYLGCNAAFAHDAGFAKPADIIGKDDYQMGWRDQAEMYRRDDRQVIESGQAKILIEEPQTTPTGETIILLTSKMPLRNPQGEIIGGLGAYMDITERKQAELIVLERADELERFNNLMVGRELRMIELKAEINALCAQFGLPSRYTLDFAEPPTNRPGFEAV
jgi:PAS domain S-box-containing protein